MKVGWGIGVVIAVLVSFAAYSFGLFGPMVTFSAAELLLSTIALLVGLWTVIAAFTTMGAKDRVYYSAWGVVLTCLSLFAYLPAAYAIGILLIAIVAMILLVVYAGRTEKIYTAATTAPPPAGGSPVAGT